MTLAQHTLGVTVHNRSRAVGKLATAILVFGFALLTGFSALWEIPLGFTPVPISGQTFAVLLAGASLGLRAGAASQILYLAMGALGLPFYSGGESGWTVLTGPTVGYLIGFAVAAAVVGHMAESKADRKIHTAVPAFMVGTLVIYLCGMVGLIAVAGMNPTQAFTLGVVPFLAGDAIKAIAAGLLLPAAWKLVETMPR